MAKSDCLVSKILIFFCNYEGLTDDVVPLLMVTRPVVILYVIDVVNHCKAFNNKQALCAKYLNTEQS